MIISLPITLESGEVVVINVTTNAGADNVTTNAGSDQVTTGE